MIVLGLISWGVGIGLLCWVFFTLVSIVVPTMAGLMLFFCAYHTGAGLASIFLGVMAGSLVLWLFRTGLTASWQPLARFGIMLVFCVPAVIVGYYCRLFRGARCGPDGDRILGLAACTGRHWRGQSRCGIICAPHAQGIPR